MSAPGTRAQAAADKRRAILDAAVRVFARQGFNGCRVSDIAEEAGVAYGLVYHYFDSKEEVLDTLFLERWDVLLHAIVEVDGMTARSGWPNTLCRPPATGSSTAAVSPSATSRRPSVRPACADRAR